MSVWRALDPTLVTYGIDAICTADPSLWAHLNNSNKNNFDLLPLKLTQKMANQIGHEAFKVSVSLRDILNDLGNVDVPDLPWGDIVARFFHQRLVMVNYHRMLINLVLEQSPNLTVFFEAKKAGDISGTAELANPFQLLATDPELRKSVKFVPVEPNRSKNLASKRRRRGLPPALRFVLRWSSRSPNFVGRFIFRYLEKLPLIRLRNSSDFTIKVLLSNELIFHYLPKFVAAGYAVSRIKISKPQIAEICRTTIKTPIFPKGSIQKRCLKAIVWRNLDQHINEYLIEELLNDLQFSLIPKAKFWSDELENEENGRNYNELIFTNALGSIEERLYACVRRVVFDSKIVSFHHGAVGLMTYYRYMLPVADMTISDLDICFNRYEASYCESCIKHVNPLYAFVSWWPEVGAWFPGVARSIVRNYWKINGNSRLVLYAPTRFKEGYIFLPDGFQDLEYWDLMQCIVLEGMQSDNFTGVVKLHKKGITAEGAKPAYYSGRTYPFEEVELPSNVTLLDDPDLTYSRHSADIIIIDRATSTIGWALASKAVVVYVSIASSPLEEEIFEILDDSIF